MKRMKTMALMAAAMLTAGATLTSCSTGDDGEVSGPMDWPDGAYTTAGDDGMNGGGGDGNDRHAGVVTAGEWNDLAHWQFWSGLMGSDAFADKSDYWQMYTNNRVAVEVTNPDGQPLAGLGVTLLRGDAPLWQTVTDNHGRAECFVGFTRQETADGTSLQLSIADRLMEGNPIVSAWDSIGEPVTNRYTLALDEPAAKRADIAFIVDATGSMGDEINFLKNDLTDIIGKAADASREVTLRTAALFYRDDDDEYLTRLSPFTDKLAETADFISKQSANGGGDYPEAVHTALERMLQDLDWDRTARSRLAFMLLDAPAHHEADVIRSMQGSVERCARLGIKLIPVAASGVDKNTEFMLRFFAVSTGGTYVFLTNDSGVGNDHMKANVGQYEVEQLNSLIVRLISEYTE